MPLDWKTTMDNGPVLRAFREIGQGAEHTASTVSKSFSMLTTSVIGAGIIGAGRAVINLASDIADSAEGVNLTTTAYQELSGVFEQGGTNSEKFNRGMTVLNNSIQEAIDGNEKTITSFERLGISWEELNTLSPEEILMEIAEALKNTTNWTESFAAANDVLGKGQTKLIGHLRAGKDAIDAQRQSIVTMSETAIKAFDATGDAAQRIGKGILSGFGNALAISQAFAETLFEDVMGVSGDFDARIASNKAAQPDAAKAPIPEDPRLKEQREKDNKTEAEMLEEYGRLEQKAAEESKKNAENIAKAQQRNAERMRAFQIDQLEGESKLQALDEERIRLSDKLIVAKEAEKAAIIEKIGTMELEIEKEKELQREAQRTANLRNLQTQLSQTQSRHSQLLNEQLNAELASPQENRESRRAKTREDRALARINRNKAAKERDERTRTTRPGSNKESEQISLSEASISALVTAIEGLIAR